MHRTLFNTPIITPILQYLAIGILWCCRWKAVGEKPTESKYLFVGAPHTSNWDLFYMLLLALAMNVKFYWMGKDSIFDFPFKHLMHWMGGIAIDRSQSNDVVAGIIKTYAECNELAIAVPPEGTRAETPYWKTGFYHIANGANIPIYLGFLDFSKREGGIGPMVIPTGNIDQDMVKIKSFYATKRGKYPNKFKTGLDE